MDPRNWPGRAVIRTAQSFPNPRCGGRDFDWVDFWEERFKKVPLHNSSRSIFADIGFALVGMVAGSHLDIRRIAGHRLLDSALKRQAKIVLASIPFTYFIPEITNVHFAPLFYVLITSSPAALVLPDCSPMCDGWPRIAPSHRQSKQISLEL
ncbi:MAG TPA: hypothetical protein VMV52_00485 [Candidatus Nanopelagicaceae bacterium]|nr:hypothetical protein [Candidatus Nanopelagicaceae bacterium]